MLTLSRRPILSGNIGRHGIAVMAACEGLGFDPLDVANEGDFIAFVAVRPKGQNGRETSELGRVG